MKASSKTIEVGAVSLGKADVLRALAWSQLGLSLAVIVWGAFVRATGSGAGCGEHWPMCNGQVLPRLHSTEVLIEFTHRLSSGLLLLQGVAIYVLARRWLARGHLARRTAAWALGLLLVEAAIGAGIVLLRLVEDDASVMRAVWIAGHLVNTLFLVAAQTLHTQAVTTPLPVWRPLDLRFKLGLAGMYGAMLVVAASGAVVALGDTLFPATSLAQGLAAKFAPAAHFLVRLRLYHPLLALATTGFVMAVALYVQRAFWGEGRIQALAKIVVLMVVAQVAIGFVNLFLLVPLWTQMLHLLAANVLWISLVLMGWAVLTDGAGVLKGDRA